MGECRHREAATRSLRRWSSTTRARAGRISTSELGAAYEGPPGHLHGGYGALVLDHLLGALASYNDPDTPAATGTISFRYQRPTRLGPVHAEAEIKGTDGRKIFVVGHLADAEGVTITAEGVFITLAARARLERVSVLR